MALAESQLFLFIVAMIALHRPFSWCLCVSCAFTVSWIQHLICTILSGSSSPFSDCDYWPGAHLSPPSHRPHHPVPLPPFRSAFSQPPLGMCSLATHMYISTPIQPSREYHRNKAA
ncbi:hypothetical protein HDK64DRAFT_124708 [Phyllosticta capitalensis]